MSEIIDIASVQTLLLTFSNDNVRKEVLNRIVEQSILTEECINEFKNLITPEAFTKSQYLRRSLVEKYPDLFLEEVFKTAESPLHISMVSYRELDNNAISKLILKSTPTDIENEVDNNEKFLDLMCKDQDIDNAILRRIKNQEKLDSLILMLQLKYGDDISSEVAKYLPNELKEEYMGNNAYADSFIKNLASSKDIAWINRMLDSILDGSKHIKVYSGCDDEVKKNILRLSNNLPESIFYKVILLRKYIPLILTKVFIESLLTEMDFNEDELIKCVNEFKAAGMYFTIKKLAIDKCYNRLLESL